MNSITASDKPFFVIKISYHLYIRCYIQHIQAHIETRVWNAPANNRSDYTSSTNGRGGWNPSLLLPFSTAVVKINVPRIRCTPIRRLVTQSTLSPFGIRGGWDDLSVEYSKISFGRQQWDRMQMLEFQTDSTTGHNGILGICAKNPPG